MELSFEDLFMIWCLLPSSFGSVLENQKVTIRHYTGESDQKLDERLRRLEKAFFLEAEKKLEVLNAERK